MSQITQPSIKGGKRLNMFENKTLVIYPNPASSNIKIQTNFEPGKNQEIIIYDALGKKVIVKKLNSGSENIDASMLPNGIYLLKVQAEGTTISAQKFIVQH